MYRLALDLKARRIVLIAGILLAASLLAMVLQRSASAQSDDIMYPENGDAPVATFTAEDPEGKDITWSLTQEGTTDFKITDGVLEFRSPPNYEAPRGGADDDSNTYTVTVVATARASTTPAIQMVSEVVTVEVANIEEDGSIMLSTLQPQVGVQVTATLNDVDTRAADGTPETITPT